MLNLTIFLPLATGLILLLIPGRHVRAIRRTATVGSAATLLSALILWAGYQSGGGLQWRTTRPWIPGINASYDVAVDGFSLPLVLLTALLLFLVALYALRQADRPKSHAFLFLLMATGLIGLFSSQDLLLFYLFFEIGLVPMYFIIGGWGHDRRSYAAMKFFLYTRAGSLAMLLSFLALYFISEPHTFSLPALIESHPLAGAGTAGSLVLLGLLIGFGVKLPTFPLHNWLPDAHVEAPTEGSVMLAGIQLKMGGFGLLRVMLPVLPNAAQRWAWVLIVLALISLIYGALAALAQSDLKRMVAYTSVNHMGFVLLGAGVWALTDQPAVRELALTGAVYQMVSHGLLTGAMFFMVGMLGESAGTRQMEQFGGLVRKLPAFGVLLGVLAFASFGLPGFSGFIAELQVIGATIPVSLAAAVVAVIGLLITTGLYLRVVTNVLLGEAPPGMPGLSPPASLRLFAVGVLAAASLVLGVLPQSLMALILNTARMMTGTGV